MRFIDSHCHLAAAAFDDDREGVIARAREAGVEAAVVVGEDYDDNLRVLDLAASEPFVRPALGHHPWRMERWRHDLPRTLALIEDHAADLVAVGEAGLDYRVAETAPARAEQRAVLEELVAAAGRHRLPLSLHGRSAGHHLLDLLVALGSPAAALHAFDGRASYAVAGAGHGFLFSLPPTTLFSRQKEKLARALPLASLLLESDAPALGPAPGERSLPEHLPRVAARVAELRGVTVQEIAAAAHANAARLFGIGIGGGGGGGSGSGPS